MANLPSPKGQAQSWLELLYNLVGGGASATPGGNAVTQDGGAAWTSVVGKAAAAVTSADMSAADAQLTDTIPAGRYAVIDDVFVSVDTAMRVDLKEETSGTIKWRIYMAANSAVQFTPRDKVRLGSGRELLARTSVAGNIGITVLYHLEA